MSGTPFAMPRRSIRNSAVIITALVPKPINEDLSICYNEGRIAEPLNECLTNKKRYILSKGNKLSPAPSICCCYGLLEQASLILVINLSYYLVMLVCFDYYYCLWCGFGWLYIMAIYLQVNLGWTFEVTSKLDIEKVIPIELLLVSTS